jgi:hypothetical protein
MTRHPRDPLAQSVKQRLMNRCTHVDILAAALPSSYGRTVWLIVGRSILDGTPLASSVGPMLDVPINPAGNGLEAVLTCLGDVL